MEELTRGCRERRSFAVCADAANGAGEVDGEHALVVNRAATVDVAVANLSSERVALPAIRFDTDDVHMRREQDRTRASGPPHTSLEHRSPVRRDDQTCRDSSGSKNGIH